MTNLSHRLDRTIEIEAPVDLVFQMLTTTEHWARWWGEGSTIDPTPGGAVLIRHPNGVEVRGEVLAVAEGRSLAFTYGYASGPIPPGGSRVEISLEPAGDATRLRLAHHFAEAEPRDHHVAGWRFQLSLFANVVAAHLHRDALARVDGWFAAWAETDAAARRAALEALVAPDVRFRDRHAAIAGLDDLDSHIGMAQKFMPGVRLARQGEPRHCQGRVLVEWTATASGAPAGTGANLFEFDARTRIADVTGFASG